MLKSNWIHCKDEIGDHVPLYKKNFTITNQVQSAFLYISARGVYEATLNEKRVGDFILAPGWTSYENRIQYQKYDITELLLEENSLIVAVAAGWYKGAIAEWWSLANEHQCALIAKLEIEYTNGRKEIIYTDDTWKAALSGYSFCEIYDGFIFDARITPDFNLKTVIAQNNSKAELIEQVGEKIIEQERFNPIEIIRTPKGETVIDFGQNLSGYVEINLTAKSGDKVSLSFAETLDINYRSAL